MMINYQVNKNKLFETGTVCVRADFHLHTRKDKEFNYPGEQIQLISGSIDNPHIQEEIVDIMEGGEEAFNKRKEIYNIWNPTG